VVRFKAMAPKERTESTTDAEKAQRDSSTMKGKSENVNNMSDEDKELKERLDTCVDTVINKDHEASVTIPIRLKALDAIVSELRTATSSMTSVPKPLKFLRPHFRPLKALHRQLGNDFGESETCQFHARLSDVLSVLAMTLGNHEERESLNFKLSGLKSFEKLGYSEKIVNELGSWGHEFVRSLAGEIGEEYASRVLDGADPKDDFSFGDLLAMVDVIVSFHITHNAEAEAVDLLIEVQRLKKLLEFEAIDESNYQRTCLYLMKTADFMSDPDDLVVRTMKK